MVNRKRKNQYIFRLDDEESWLLFDLVQKSGKKSQQEYVRTCVLGAQVVNTSGITKQLLPSLIRIGNNLNQLVKHCHATGTPVAAEEAEAMRKEVSELCVFLKQLVAETL